MSFDRQRLMQNVEEDEDFARELVSLFLEGLPVQLDTLREALSAQDADGARELAHSIKGAISNFDLGAPWEAALALEQLGRGGDLSQGERHFLEFERRMSVLVEELRAFLGEETR